MKRSSINLVNGLLLICLLVSGCRGFAVMPSVVGTTRTGTASRRHPQAKYTHLRPSRQQSLPIRATAGDETVDRPGFLRRTFPNFPWHQLPNAITSLRCIFIPLFVMFFYNQPYAFCKRPSFWIYVLAAWTDWLDGYLARRWKVTSSWGAFLDPVADKLLVSTCLILLTNRYPFLVIPTAIIVARELAVSALREWMALQGQSGKVQVGWQGKFKTAATLVATSCLLWTSSSSSTAAVTSAGPLLRAGMVGMYLSTLVTVTSGCVYFQAAAPTLLAGKEDN